ncbi:MAG: T3SS effector HopA1 family protein, partial [Bacteroidota bacterium]
NTYMEKLAAEYKGNGDPSVDELLKSKSLTVPEKNFLKQAKVAIESGRHDIMFRYVQRNKVPDKMGEWVRTNNFFHYLHPTVKRDNNNTENNWRVYVTLNPDKVARLLKKVLDYFVDSGQDLGVYELKPGNPASVHQNTESLTIYCNSEKAREMVVRFLIEDQNQHSKDYIKDSPKWTKEAGKGIAYGQNTQDGSSFGKLRARAVSVATEKNIEKDAGIKYDFGDSNPGTEQGLRTMIENEFADLGIHYETTFAQSHGRKVQLNRIARSQTVDPQFATLGSAANPNPNNGNDSNNDTNNIDDFAISNRNNNNNNTSDPNNNNNNEPMDMSGLFVPPPLVDENQNNNNNNNSNDENPLLDTVVTNTSAV